MVTATAVALNGSDPAGRAERSIGIAKAAGFRRLFQLFTARPAVWDKMGACWTSQGRFAKRRPLAMRFFGTLFSGRIAQLVEQLTLNQRVPGSSPGAPTTCFLAI